MKIGQYLAELYQLKQRGPIIMNHRVHYYCIRFSEAGLYHLSLLCRTV